MKVNEAHQRKSIHFNCDGSAKTAAHHSHFFARATSLFFAKNQMSDLRFEEHPSKNVWSRETGSQTSCRWTTDFVAGTQA
jgi:hypothetical protein